MCAVILVFLCLPFIKYECHLELMLSRMGFTNLVGRGSESIMSFEWKTLFSEKFPNLEKINLFEEWWLWSWPPVSVLNDTCKPWKWHCMHLVSAYQVLWSVIIMQVGLKMLLTLLPLTILWTHLVGMLGLNHWKIAIFLLWKKFIKGKRNL